MMTDELRLLTDAAELARAHPPRHAVILDLSGVLHIDEPVFHRTLARWLRGEMEEGRPAPGVVPYELAHNRMVLVVDDDALPQQRAALARVAGILAEHRRGSLKAQWFALATQADSFAATIRALAEATAAGQERPGELARGSALARFLAMERSLHAVDLSALVRQGTIYRLEPGSPPVPVMLELTVSLAELDRLFDSNLSRDPWLHGRVTELLDRRMLYHLARDRDEHPLPLAVKMHADTVAGAEFARRTGDLPARRQGRLVVELPYLEWLSDRDQMVRAITVARRQEIGVAIDHVPTAALVDGDLPEADLYRIMWVDDEGHRSDLTSAGPLVAKLGAERCLLARCIDSQAITDGLAAGIRLFQGRAVDRMSRDQASAAAEKRAEEIVQEEQRSEAAGTEDAVPTPGGGLVGWVKARLGLGGTTPPA